MKPKVYLETSVISYLTSRPSRDLIVAGHQQTTQDWWAERRHAFHLVASQLVMNEASSGDVEAAKARLEVLASVELLEAREDGHELAVALVADGPIPTVAAEDALHIAIAVTHGVEYLLTWNCKHIANASMRSSIDRICRRHGYEPTILCTPEELLED